MFSRAIKRKNGFTIIELLVTMAVFAIVAAAAISLFQFHGKSSGGSTKRKLAREVVTLALLTIQKDIERAGLGLIQQQPLSMVVNHGASDRPDQLYVSFSEHVSMDWDKTKPWSFFDALSSPGKDKVWFTLSGGSSISLTNVGAWIGTDGQAPPIGGLIRQQGANKPDAVDLGQFSATQSGSQPSKGQCTASLILASGFSGNVAPAISYKLITSSADQALFGTGRKPQLGTLLRNAMPLSGAGIPLIGAWQGEKTPFIKVTDFQVRCGFRQAACNFSDYYTDHSRTACWAPDNGRSLGDPGWEMDRLRVVEVTIKYILLDKGGGAKYPSRITTGGFRLPEDNTPGPWALGGAVTITVAPRNSVLAQYLAPPPK